MNLEIDYLWSHKCPKKWDQYTLIALVITIIVLLILAGITIATLTGDNGLLTKAGEARNTNIDAENMEKIKLAYQDYYLGKHTQSRYTFQNAVDKIFGEGAAIVTGKDTDGYTVTYSEKDYFISPTGNVQKLAKWNDNGNNTFTHSETGQTVEVGDTVYYNSGVAAYEGSGDNQGKWGVLGVENGQLLIMSKENVASVYLSGKQDWLTDGTTKLNNACSPFKNTTYADSVRSVKMEDINKITGYESTMSPVMHTFTMVGGHVKRDDIDEPVQSINYFEDINGRKLPDETSISVSCLVTSYGYRLWEVLTEESKEYSLFNVTTYEDAYWLNTKAVMLTDTCSVDWEFARMEGMPTWFGNTRVIRGSVRYWEKLVVLYV